MRWNKSKNPINKEERRVTRFLFFPKTINNETRWLETTTFIQICIYFDPDWSDGYNKTAWHWIDLRWGR